MCAVVVMLVQNSSDYNMLSCWLVLTDKLAAF